ncbi:MAG: TetR/AcrR family transcriptional regulator [Actinomycetaceae bacterium]
MTARRGPDGAPLRGRPRTIDRVAIADAALDLAADGLDALTLHAVAERLGVRRSALYHHVDGRDGLLRLLADRFAESVRWPEPDDDWRTYLRAVAAAIDESCARYPGVIEIITHHVWPVPRASVLGAMRATEHLTQLGLPRPLAVAAADFVASFAADERIRRDRILRLAASGQAFTGSLTGEDAGWAQMREGFDAHFDLGPEAWTSTKLEIILDGIQAQLDATTGTATS